MQKRWLKTTLIVLCIFGLFMSAGAGYVFWLYKEAYKNDRDAFLTLAKMGFNNFLKIEMPAIDLKETDFRSICFRGANFYTTDLRTTDFRESDLSLANLSRANLSKADLSCAILVGTDLSFTNLSDANLSQANLDFAYFGKYINATPEQLSKCKSIKNIWGPNEDFLKKVQKLNPKLMEWWDGKSRKMSDLEWHNFRRQLEDN